MHMFHRIRKNYEITHAIQTRLLKTQKHLNSMTSPVRKTILGVSRKNRCTCYNQPERKTGELCFN